MQLQYPNGLSGSTFAAIHLYIHPIKLQSLGYSEKNIIVYRWFPHKNIICRYLRGIFHYLPPAHHSALGLFFLAFSPSTAGTPFCPASITVGLPRALRSIRDSASPHGIIINGFPNPAPIFLQVHLSPGHLSNLLCLPLDGTFGFGDHMMSLWWQMRCQVSNSSHHCPGAAVSYGSFWQTFSDAPKTPLWSELTIN